MFGAVKAKLGGLRHILRVLPRNPSRARKYQTLQALNNRECLRRHAGARSFEQGAVHTADPDLLPAIKANKTSCISSGCHDVVHDVAKLKGAKFWRGDISGIILILGLVVEALCLLLGHGPIAFMVVASLGGALFAVGILLYLYSLVSAKSESPEQ